MNPSFQTPMLSLPSAGMKALPLLLDFTNDATLTKYVTDEILQINNMDFIQSIYCDNSANNDPITFTFRGILTAGYKVKFPALTQGWMPVLAPKGMIEFVAATALGQTVNIQLGNFPVAPIIWPSALVSNVTADMTPIVANMVNRSLTASGADEALMAVNAARKRMFVQNHPNNMNPLYVECAGAASPVTSMALAAGQSFDSGTGPVSGQAVRVLGTLGDLVIAWEQ